MSSTEYFALESHHIEQQLLRERLERLRHVREAAARRRRTRRCRTVELAAAALALVGVGHRPALRRLRAGACGC